MNRPVVLTAPRAAFVTLAMLALALVPGMSGTAYAADCHGDQNGHPDCFSVFVDKADRQDLYWASGSYDGSLLAFTMTLELKDGDGKVVEYETKICHGSCRIGTDSHSSGDNDSFCARLSASVGDVSVFSDTKCRVV